MSQRHGTKAIRLTRETADLLAWYEEYADQENFPSLNAALLHGLTAHRAVIERARDRAAERRVRAEARTYREGRDHADVSSL